VSREAGGCRGDRGIDRKRHGHPTDTGMATRPMRTASGPLNLYSETTSNGLRKEVDTMKTQLAPNTLLMYVVWVLAAMAVLLAADWTLADAAHAGRTYW
jgi:hypothetical protein